MHKMLKLVSEVTPIYFILIMIKMIITKRSARTQTNKAQTKHTQKTKCQMWK